jgi:hypothetical protein
MWGQPPSAVRRAQLDWRAEAMKAQVYSADVANRFAAVAQEFCSIIESASKTDRTTLLMNVYGVLPLLISGAISLPNFELSEEDDATEREEQSPSRPSVRMTDEQWGQLYNQLKEKLGDWNLYQCVFDPTTDKKAICGSLADDIADIYRDLKEGLVCGKMHQAKPQDIVWTWRLLYYSHWGHHAMDALLVIHFRLEDTLS